MDFTICDLDSKCIVAILVEAVKMFNSEMKQLNKSAEDISFREMERLCRVIDIATSHHLHIQEGPSSPRDGIQYLEVYEGEDFGIGVFVMPPHSRIPLHDHPGMCVVSRLLEGSLQTTCYDWISDENEERRQHGQRGRRAKRTVSSSWHTAPCSFYLLPQIRNSHEFLAGPLGAKILDVLLPPYNPDQERDCTYYEVIEESFEDRPCRSDAKTPGLVWLEPIPPPEEFSVVASHYSGPSYSPENGHLMEKPQLLQIISTLVFPDGNQNVGNEVVEMIPEFHFKSEGMVCGCVESEDSSALLQGDTSKHKNLFFENTSLL